MIVPAGHAIVAEANSFRLAVQLTGRPQGIEEDQENMSGTAYRHGNSAVDARPLRNADLVAG